MTTKGPFFFFAVLAVLIAFGFWKLSSETVDPNAHPEEAKRVLVGTWKSTLIEEAGEMVTSYKVTRNSDGSIVMDELFVDHVNREFRFYQSNGAWALEGSFYTEEFDGFVDIFRIVRIGEEKFTYAWMDEDELVPEIADIPERDLLSDFRTVPAYELPTAPEGYTRVYDERDVFDAFLDMWF